MVSWKIMLVWALMAIIPLASSILYHPEDARGLDGSEGKSQDKDKHINLKHTKLHIYHSDNNSKTPPRSPN